MMHSLKFKMRSNETMVYERTPLKVQSCKLCNNKSMIASTQITNTENFAFIAVLVFKLLGRKQKRQ